MGELKALLVICMMSVVHVSSDFRPHIQMPYLKISGSSTPGINKIGSTLTCDEQRNSLKDCATECFERRLTNTGCPGFYVNGTQNGLCFLCHVSSRAEITGNSSTNIGNNDIMYLQKTPLITPDLSLNFDNYSGDTIYGYNIIGTASGIADSDHVFGIKDKALYLHDGGRVYLPGSGNECWTNLDHCTSGMTISIWYNTKAIFTHHIVSSGRVGETGLNVHLQSDTYLAFNVVRSTVRYFRKSSTSIAINTWYLLTAVYDGDNGLSQYVDGIRVDGLFRTVFENASTDDYNAHLGDVHGGPYNSHGMNGYVDEFKYFYRALNSIEIWKEFVGYDLDLNLPAVIPSPDHVASDNDYNNIVDGNQETCVSINHTTCYHGLKVKIWNSAIEKSNYTVTMTTENLKCDDGRFLVYGESDSNSNLDGSYPDERLHFLGKKKILRLESSSVNNDQNEYVFRHLCEEICHYVFIYVQNVPDESSWKICEVKFQ